MFSRTGEFSSKSIENKQNMISGRFKLKVHNFVSQVFSYITKSDSINPLLSLTDSKTTDGTISSTDNGVVDTVHSEIIVDSAKYHSSIMQVD